MQNEMRSEIAYLVWLSYAVMLSVIQIARCLAVGGA